MKKNLLLVTASLLALGMAAPAMAADLAARPYTKAPPMMMAPMYDWSGFYIGINGGGGRTDFDQDINATGGTVGGQIGYRWQAASWVFGLEAQGNWADFSGSTPAAITQNGVLVDTGELRARTESFGLFTGQVGYAWNNVLLYVKGGAAVVNNKYHLDFSDGTNLASANETRWGGTVGAGLEIGFAPNWTIGAEWNHIFMNDNDVNLAVNSAYGGGVIPMRGRNQDIDMGLVRLNYKFGGPVVAKY